MGIIVSMFSTAEDQRESSQHSDMLVEMTERCVGWSIRDVETLLSRMGNLSKFVMHTKLLHRKMNAVLQPNGLETWASTRLQAHFRSKQIRSVLPRLVEMCSEEEHQREEREITAAQAAFEGLSAAQQTALSCYKESFSRCGRRPPMLSRMVRPLGELIRAVSQARSRIPDASNEREDKSQVSGRSPDPSAVCVVARCLYLCTHLGLDEWSAAHVVAMCVPGEATSVAVASRHEHGLHNVIDVSAQSNFAAWFIFHFCIEGLPDQPAHGTQASCASPLSVSQRAVLVAAKAACPNMASRSSRSDVVSL